jgi:MSHA pilin protein MshC
MMRVITQQKGFTLVELVVIIVVLGTLSAVAIPKFFDQQDYKERLFKDDLVSALRYAQKRAVASGENVKVSMTSSGFTLSYDDGTSVPHPNGELQYTQSSYGVPSNITMQVSTITFDALGRLDPSDVDLTDVGFTSSGIDIVGETGCVTQ